MTHKINTEEPEKAKELRDAPYFKRFTAESSPSSIKINTISPFATLTVMHNGVAPYRIFLNKNISACPSKLLV